MDRLVKPDVKEVELSFKSDQICSSVLRLTNLMHTMSVAVSFTTTNPGVYSFSQPYAIIAPLSSLSCTLHLQPSDQPPLRTPHDAITVRSAMLPTGKAQPEDLRRLFSVPGRHVFRDAEIPIALVGPHTVNFLVSNHSKFSELNSFLAKAVSGCTTDQITKSLALAVRSENADLVSAMIDAGADVNARDSGGRSILFLAVELGNTEIVKVLIAARCEIDESVDKVLHEAARSNRVDLIEILCKSFAGINVDSADSENRTPVHVAASRGHVEALQYLLSIGADADAADERGRTPLHHAAAEGHLLAVEALLERTSAKYGVDGDGKTAFALTAENGHSGLFAALRLNDALHRAARLGDAAGVRSCLAEGAAVDGRDQRGWTPLHRAAFKGRVECARVLLDRGAEVDAADEVGYTPLRCAVESGHTAVAMLLIAHGARVSTKSLKGLSPVNPNADRFARYPALVVRSLCQRERADLS